MRKHRLAECLLVDMIKLPWEDAERGLPMGARHLRGVERRLSSCSGTRPDPPHGNPIPGLSELA